jgi:HJR/Mrr/RecB family endonuclease
MVECNSDEDGATTITNREYEQREQDSKRQIRLLDKRHLGDFIEEFNSLISK